MAYLEEIKAILRSLVLSSQYVMTIDNLNNEYRKIEGECIPFQKLGFKDLESFLRFISDTIIICGVGGRATVVHIPNGKSIHISEMIKNQKIPTSIGRQQRFHNYTETKANQYNKRNKSGLNFHTNREISNKNDYANCHICTPPKLAQSNSKLSSEQSFLSKASTNGKQSNHCKNLSNYKSQKKGKNIIEKMNINIQRDSQNLKYCVENDFASNVKITKQNIARRNVGNLKNYSITTKEFSQKNDTQITEDQINNMVENDFSPTNKMLRGFYSNNRNHEKPRNETKNLLTNTARIQNVFLEYNEIERNYGDIDEAVPEFAANNLVFQCDFPDDTAKFGDKIENYPFPNEITTESILKLYICEIHSPFKFWFQLRNDTKILHKLTTHINNFYNNFDEKEYCIPHACIIPGQVCGALYNNIWHRGKIVSKKRNNSAKVLFVDFGTVCYVDVNHIKFLPMVFTQLPRQALRGSLSHIQPDGLHWNYKATNYLVSMVADKMLYGKVSEINIQNECIYFVICDTYEPKVIQINEHLIIKGYAHFDMQWMERRKKKNGGRLHHVREDYPTFVMLEEGEYPTFYELMNLCSNGIDYEHITDRIMYHPGRLNTMENISESIRNLPFQLLTTNPFRGEILLSLTL